MKTSHIIKLLAGITVAATLCACGGGGGGGGGGDKNWSTHPGSDDPKSIYDEAHLLKGRTLLLTDGLTTYSFRFELSGECTVKRTNNDGDINGTLDGNEYIYQVLSTNSARASFSITFNEEWDGEGKKVQTVSGIITFSSAKQASMALSVDNGEAVDVPATFELIAAPKEKN